jgi:predicted dehydrogenase
LSRARVPVGVVGVGSLGFHHARILAGLEDGAEMVGIHDADPERAAAVAEQLGVRAFSTADELFAQVEAAVIAVPTTAHAEVALAGLERGVHLMIEKPIAPSLEEADRILERAEAAGALIQTGHVERFNGALSAAADYLNEPRFIESHRLASFNPRGTDVAVVLDLMIHDIDLVLSLVGEEVRSVDAVGVPVLTPSVDIANARIGFAGGAVANITASRVSRERLRKVRCFQRSGYLSLDLATGTGEFLRLRDPARLGEMMALAAASGAGGADGLALDDVVERIEFRGDEREPLRRELEAFLAAVRGEQAVVVSGRDGRRGLAVALEIVQRIEDHVVDSHPA